MNEIYGNVPLEHIATDAGIPECICHSPRSLCYGELLINKYIPMLLNNANTFGFVLHYYILSYVHCALLPIIQNIFFHKSTICFSSSIICVFKTLLYCFLHNTQTKLFSQQSYVWILLFPSIFLYLYIFMYLYSKLG